MADFQAGILVIEESTLQEANTSHICPFTFLLHTKYRLFLTYLSPIFA